MNKDAMNQGVQILLDRMDTNPEEFEDSLAHKEKENHDDGGGQRRLLALNVAHSVAERNDHRNTPDDIDHREEDHGYAEDF
jgi:hypothetical protein